MRERINRLARGIVENSVPELVLKPERVEAVIPAGQVIRGELGVVSGNNLHIKGLAYSDDERVKVVTSAFGGLRNRITYEVNTRYSEHGDEIKGSFYLVTNGGEREIPYSLRIQAGNPDENLGSLKTARDFANLAKRDRETALRMFEYQDFTEAPFMQDARTRSIYEGLKGRSTRTNLLEEFLVALHVKDPVRLTVDARERIYENVEQPVADGVDIRASGWGYVSAEISSDAPFVRLLAQKVTDRDFDGGRCRVPYQIQPEFLHRGKNFGRICLRTQGESFVIRVEAEKSRMADRAGRGGQGEEQADKGRLARYLALRLDYETGAGDRSLLLNQMMQETEAIRADYPGDLRIRLMQAELLLLNGRRENGAMVLEEARDAVLKNRESRIEEYCYYQYLKLLVQPSQDGQESLIRYIRKLLWEDGRRGTWLFLLLMRVDGALAQNPLELYHSLEKLYQEGSSSPFIYGAACRLVEENPGLLVKMGNFELQFLHLGVRRGMVSRETAKRAAGYLLGFRHYRRLAARLAMMLYQAYPEMELLEAVCSLLIRGDKRGPEAFAWYEKALGCRVNLTRLYEYFLYSLPENYGHLLPKEVLLYFSYDKDLDSRSRSVLYQNILRYMNPSSELYGTYLRDMEAFAMEQLFKSRIDSRLAVIYEHVIYRDMIDSRVARVLPGILKACRIACEDPAMRYVIVRDEELMDEAACPLENGVAYVPVFSDHPIFFFQDAYGNRYLNVKHRRMPVMDKPELLAQCGKVFPDHPMLKLGKCLEVLKKGIQDGREAGLLEEAMAQMKLNPVFESRILKEVTDYYCRAAETEEGTGAFNCTYLIQMDKRPLGERQRQQICETLISQNYMREAYEMIREYGSQYIPPDKLMKLCARTILQQLFDQDPLLLILSYRAFRAGFFDGVMLDYLCEHFNGTVPQMYEILIQGVGAHVETYDLEERLLCQQLFTGCCEQMDSVFDLYMSRKQTRESVVKAYFTQKSIQYFLGGEKADPRVFSYLKKAMLGAGDRERMPTIYLLALTKYFSAMETLDEEERGLCRSMTAVLLREGLVFPYTRDLSRHIPIPEDILDKAMIEYRGSKERGPELMLRIQPQENEFHGEEMRRVYQGIYVKEKVLFEGETMEYRIYETVRGERQCRAQGSIQCDHKLEGRENSRFACLNRMGAALEAKDEKALFGAMEDYLKKSAALGRLFPIE